MESNTVVILAALFAISEALALIPQIKSNSVFQFLFNLLKTLIGKGRGV